MHKENGAESERLTCVLCEKLVRMRGRRKLFSSSHHPTRFAYDELGKSDVLSTLNHL